MNGRPFGKPRRNVTGGHALRAVKHYRNATQLAILAHPSDPNRQRDMTRIRFVHAADLHLDSPFVGIKAAAPDNVASALHGATFAAYENIIKLCIDERVDALLIAGDVYDSADRSLRAQLKFVDGLNRLNDAGIRSFVCHGNHDPLDGWEARLDFPPSCIRFGAEFEAVPVFEHEPIRAVVHGISYPTRDVYENLVPRLGTVDPNTFSIGLMHANVDGNADHAPYAPCSLADLVFSGISYWALGHVHTRQVRSDPSPIVVYPGNSQGRHPNETGARGVYLVEVDDGGTVNFDFRAVDTVRWERPVLDISRMETEQDLRDGLHQSMESALAEAEGRSVVLRIALTGRGGTHSALRQPNFIQDLIDDLTGEWSSRSPFAWCERIEDETRPPFNRQERIKGSDFLAEVLKTSDRAKDDDDMRARMREGLSDLYQHPRYRRLLAGDAPDDDDLAALTDEAEAIVVDLLAGDDV